jgi:predicted outer membrane repeat protein
MKKISLPFIFIIIASLFCSHQIFAADPCITISFSVSAVHDCFPASGTAQITSTVPTTGVAPFTYSFDNGFTFLGSTTSPLGLSVGTYTVIAKDANDCTNSKTISIVKYVERLYVDADIAASGDGSSWTNAFKTLQEAIAAAPTLCSNKEIWVANGIYKPTSGTNRSATFAFPNGVKMYGGFAGGETTIVGRNFVANETILSGDIGAASTADNSYNIMTMIGLTSTSLLDGFTMSGGNANALNLQNGSGGAIYLTDALNANIIFSNMKFTDNFGNYGGAISVITTSPFAIDGCKPSFTDCSFSNDSATYGGAIYMQMSPNTNSEINTNFLNCTFSNNKASGSTAGLFMNNASANGKIKCKMDQCTFSYNVSQGFIGAVYFNSNAILGGNIMKVKNCIFNDNIGTNAGGGLCSSFNKSSDSCIVDACRFIDNIATSPNGLYGSGGGLQLSSGKHLITNTTFINNKAIGTSDDGGGGIMIYGGQSHIINCSFNNNSTKSSYNQSGNTISIYPGASAFLKNCIVWGDSAEHVKNVGSVNYLHCNVKGVAAAGTNISKNPQYVSNTDLHLKDCSKCINAGNNAYLPMSITQDLDAAARINGANVDMGAYEFIGTPVTLISNFTNYSANSQCVSNNLFYFLQSSTISSGSIAGFQWTFGNGASSANNNPNITFLNAGVYNVTLTTSAANGCMDDYTATVTVNPHPTVTVLANSATNLFSGDVVDLDITSPTGANVVYSWSAPGPLSSNTDNITATVTTANAGIYTASAVDNNGCEGSTFVTVTVNPAVKLRLKALLNGAFQVATGLMHDSLRVKGLLPLTEPYSGAPYNYVQVGGNPLAQCDPMLLSTSAASTPNSMVDWVFVQLRSAADSSVVVATKNAILQRDGDVVDVDGVSPMLFKNAAPGNYFISIKHRNHMGVMTANKIALAETPVTINLINGSVPLHVTATPNAFPLSGSSKVVGGFQTLYSGNMHLVSGGNRFVNYSNLLNSDRTTLFSATGSTSTINGYIKEDADLNGYARFNGLNADRLIILNTCANQNSVIVTEQTPN